MVITLLFAKITKRIIAILNSKKKISAKPQITDVNYIYVIGVVSATAAQLPLWPPDQRGCSYLQFADLHSQYNLANEAPAGSLVSSSGPSCWQYLLSLKAEG